MMVGLQAVALRGPATALGDNFVQTDQFGFCVVKVKGHFGLKVSYTGVGPKSSTGIGVIALSAFSKANLSAGLPSAL
jgi:hypothetical protein